MLSSAFTMLTEVEILTTKNSASPSPVAAKSAVDHPAKLEVQVATPMNSLTDSELNLHQEVLEVSSASASNSELWMTTTADHLTCTSSPKP